MYALLNEDFPHNEEDSTAVDMTSFLGILGMFLIVSIFIPKLFDIWAGDCINN